MKKIAILCLAALSAGALAKQGSNQWIQDHFGLNFVMPSMHPNNNNYLLPSYAMQTWNENDTAICGPSAFNYANGGALSDVNGCTQYTNIYWITNRLPAKTSIRVPVSIWESFKNPNGALVDPGHIFAILDRMSLGTPRRANTADGLNILWVLMPGLPPYTFGTNTDAWSALGAPNTNLRDFARPAPGTSNQVWQKLSANISNFINLVNVLYGIYGGWLTPNNGAWKWTGTTNFIQKQSFQLGNEPGVGHSGGSTDGVVGSWNGMGALMQATTTGHNWGFDPNYNRGTLGYNERVLPAFSFLMEGSNQVTGRSTPYFQLNWAEGASPGLNEIFTYFQEMSGPTNNYTWASQCSRRSGHFRSPQLRCRVDNTINNPAKGYYLVYPGTPNSRWETATEYADRWFENLNRLVQGISNLRMPGTIPPIVDITECYVTHGDLAYLSLGQNYNFANKSLATVREDARQAAFAQSTTGLPPKRIDVLAAIRNKLVSTPIPNLGKIYWWGGYDPRPRVETGLYPEDSGAVNAYYPYIDFRLTREEIRTLFPAMAP